MKQLHPRAIFLFWFHFLTQIIPASRARKTTKLFLVFVNVFLIAVFVSYAFFAISHLIGELSSQEGDLKEVSLFNWAQNSREGLQLSSVLGLVGAVACVIILISFVSAFLYYRNYTYQVTDRSIKVRKGIFTIHEAEVPFDKIQNVDIFRSLMHRILGLSHLCIQTAGYSKGETADLHPGLVSEASIDGISSGEADEIRMKILEKQTAR